MKAIIGIGSKSKLQTGAIIRGTHGIFHHLRPGDHSRKVEFISFDAPSLVHVQAVGFSETYRGASNRMEFAREQLGKNSAPLSIAVGVKNGIWEYKGSWFDFTVIIVRVNNHRPLTKISDLMVIPTTAVQKTKAIGYDKITIGQTLHQYFDPTIQPFDPHRYLTEGLLSRRTLIARAAHDLFQRAVRENFKATSLSLTE